MLRSTMLWQWRKLLEGIVKMANYRKLLELAHRTTELALEDSNRTPYPDWEELTPETYKEILGFNNLIHSALVVVLYALEPLVNLRLEGVNSKPDLDFTNIYLDPRGYAVQLNLLSSYLGSWRNNRQKIPITDLV